MHLHTYVMLRCCTFSCTCTHTSCYAAVRSHALAHIRHATLLYVLMHLHTYVMLRRCTFSCTCTHTSCYAAVHFHALAHIRHATLLYVLMHLHTYVMLRCCTFSCTCTHVMPKLLYVLMHLHTYVMLRCCTFSCTCTHTSCYAAVRSHALAHIRHATLLYVLMHFQIVGRVLGGWLWICKWWWWWWWWWWWNLLLMLKFRFSAFCGPPCKMFEKWQQRGPPQMPGTLFLYVCYDLHDLPISCRMEKWYACFSGWWFEPTLKNHGVNVTWDDDIPFPIRWESQSKFHGSSHRLNQWLLTIINHHYPILNQCSSHHQPVLFYSCWSRVNHQATAGPSYPRRCRTQSRRIGAGNSHGKSPCGMGENLGTSSGNS